MNDEIGQVIAAQAADAIEKKKWAQLRFIGNRFERARCYRDWWFVLAQASEATTHHQLEFGRREVFVPNDPRLHPPIGLIRTKQPR